MNLQELNTGAGAPQTKPWLTPVAYTLECETFTAATANMDNLAVVDSLSAGTATFFRSQTTLPWRSSGPIPVVSGLGPIAVTYGQFIGGVGLVGLTGTGSFIAPNSLQINTVLPDATTGSLICFTVINKNPAVVGSSITGPDGVIVPVPAAQSATKATSTPFWYQKVAFGDVWVCVNA